MRVDLGAKKSPRNSTGSSITEDTERRTQSTTQSHRRQQGGKQMLTPLLLPKNAHPHNLLPLSKTYSRFSSYTNQPRLCRPRKKKNNNKKPPNLSAWWGGGLKKWSNKIGPFFFWRKTRNEALCTSAAVAHLTGLLRLLLCHQHKGDWGRTQTEPLCRCGAGY